MVQTEMAAEAIKTAFPSVPIEINGYETNMMDFIMVPAVMTIITLGVYKLFELFVY